MPRTYRPASTIFLFVSLCLVFLALFALRSGPSSSHALNERRAVVESDNASHIRPAENLAPSRNNTPFLHPPARVHHGRSTASTFTRKIVAIGDLHGDGAETIDVLKMAGVVDDAGDWTGNIDFLVQTGDIIDRGRDTQGLFEYMDNLRSQASGKGGAVLSLLGNHEFMNLQDDWTYVHPDDLASFPSVMARKIELRSGKIGRSWALHYTVACRLPLHPSLGPPNSDYDSQNISPLSHAALAFVHGGLPPAYPDLEPFPSRINNLGRSALRKYQTYQEESLVDAENRLLGEDGPLWYRGWAQLPEEEVCAQADVMLEKLGVRQMIIGHTPQLDDKGILSRCGGKIIDIDTGISSFFHGGAGSALYIEYTLSPEYAGDVEPTVWIEREVVKAVYRAGREILMNSERRVTGRFGH